MKSALMMVLTVAGAMLASAETLYNGIELPKEWPPRRDVKDREPQRVPYLEAANIPKVIPVDVGRQLFVDDFLVDASTFRRTYHHPVKFEGNPVLKPETDWETGKDLGRKKGFPQSHRTATVRPCGGGIWWDAEKGVFRLWYEAGMCREICYAESPDGIRWTRPSLDIEPGTNKLLPDQHTDSWSVVPDPDSKDSDQRWKLYVRRPGGDRPSDCYTSADGIHWTNHVTGGVSGDRSTMFYNPFRKKWVFSLRASWFRRSRMYVEADDFLSGCQWTWPYDWKVDWKRSKQKKRYRNTENCFIWLAADKYDVQSEWPELNKEASLYSFDAVAYESIMLGGWEIHWGPENRECEKIGLPKITDIQFAYSRDGFSFSRPDRTAAIASERWGAYGKKWDVGYVQPISNLCVVQGDELWFYYGGFQGNTNATGYGAIYTNAGTGFAKLRRDGFASMDADASGATLVTRTIRFDTGDRLFVNAAAKGSLAAEILDASSGEVLATGSAAGFDATKTCLATDLKKCRGREIKVRFIGKDASLYAFWFSDEKGVSRGYLAGGGPGYKGLRDL